MRRNVNTFLTCGDDTGMDVGERRKTMVSALENR
jgi:hypothetical protein